MHYNTKRYKTTVFVDNEEQYQTLLNFLDNLENNTACYYVGANKQRIDEIKARLNISNNQNESNSEDKPNEMPKELLKQKERT